MIVYCCNDLFFASKISGTATAMKVVSRPVRDGKSLENRLKCVEDGKANGPVTGLMVDLATGETAMELIRMAKGFDAKVAVVAFGSHLETGALQEAREAGADFVMSNGQLSANLPAIVERLTPPTTIPPLGFPG